MKTVYIIGTLLLFLLFGGIAIKMFLFTPHSIGKSIDMAYEVTNETLTGKNAIATYEWFKNREGEIEALYGKEVTAQEEIDAFLEFYPDTKSWTREDKAEHARLRANLTGVKNMLDTAIADYNAKSGMVNKAIFKDNLPSNLTRAYYTGKELRK